MVVELRVVNEGGEYKMALKLTKIKEQKKAGSMLLLMQGVSDIFANTIRRLILEEVPTLAVEDVEIKDNNSALYDEMLALRLGLVPIKTDLSSYRLPKNEEELKEKSARCTLQLRLKSTKKGYLYAGDVQSSDPKCTFVYPTMPITKILSKQKIDVTLTAVMGQGKDHVKWSPGWAFYKHEPVVKLGAVVNAALVVQKCSDGVFTLKGNKLELNNDKIYESNLLDYYATLDDGIKVSSTDNIVFSVESWGQLSIKQMLDQAGQILVAKVEEMEKLL
jgi:DNA-directed RNA polymerase subunit D